MFAKIPMIHTMTVAIPTLKSKSKYIYGPDHLESIILKIIGKKINNFSCHLQSIIPENNRFFAYYSST